MTGARGTITDGDPALTSENSGLGNAGRATRLAVPVGAVVLVYALPVLAPLDYHADLVSRAAIFGIVALSMNVLIGHLGHVSLGHQAFFGFGAFASAMITTWGLPLSAGLIAAMIVGALTTLLLGYVALRIRGANFAVVTLAFGVVAEISIFQIGQLVAGITAPVPEFLQSSRAYAYLCLAAVTLAYVFDWRLMATKYGRAMLAIRDSEDVSRSFGISVRNFKLLAFAISGALAGLAGALFGHQLGTVSAQHEFDLLLGITFVLMTVIGGPGNRVGVLIGGMSFGVLSDLLRVIGLDAVLVPIVGAGFLVLVLTRFPGGIGQQLAPLDQWVRGGRFDMRAMQSRHRVARKSASATSDVGLQSTQTPGQGDTNGHSQVSAVGLSALSMDEFDQRAWGSRWMARPSTTLAGAGAVTGGLIVIAFAWDSAAQLDWAPAQLPYAISGGIFGIALIVIGSGLLIGQALYRAALTDSEHLQSMARSIGQRFGQRPHPAVRERFRPAPRTAIRVNDGSSDENSAHSPATVGDRGA